MKILVVSDYDPALLDSLFQTLEQNEAAEYTLLRKLVKRRVHYPSTEVVNLPMSTSSAENPLRLTSLLPVVAYLAVGMFAGLILVLKRRVDAIVGVYAFPQGLVAAIVGRLTGRRYVILTDGGDVNNILPNPIVRIVMLWQLEKAFAVTAQNNKKWAQLFSLGVRRRILTTTHIGIDTTRFAPRVQKEPRTVLFVARMAPEKCPLVLIEALRILRQRGVLVKLRMVGDGPLKTQIENTAAFLGVGHLLTMEGYVPYREVQRFYGRSAIFVLPSRHEAVSSSLLEAMSSECICIVSDIGDNLEVIRPMFNGFVFHLDNAKDLADKICDVLSLPKSEIARLTSNARETVEKHYSVQVVGKTLGEIMSELVQS
jgi:glycosyltransferase involved in cell wall biosynthesis